MEKLLFSNIFLLINLFYYQTIVKFVAEMIKQIL